MKAHQPAQKEKLKRQILQRYGDRWHRPPGTTRIAQPRLRIHDLYIGRRDPWKDVAHAHPISRFSIRTGRTAAPKDDGVHCRAIVALHPPAGIDAVAGTGGGTAVAGDNEIRHGSTGRDRGTHHRLTEV